MQSHAQGRLGQLYEAHALEATRFAYFLTNDLATAEDLVQEAFLKIASRLGQLRRAETFETYLRRIILNLVRMQHRRLGVERRYLERESRERPLNHIDDPGSDSGLDDGIRNAMAALPLKQRAAIGLRYYFDLADPQIAEILGCSEGTVRSSVSRGLATLRRRIESVAKEAGVPDDQRT